mmetsp:Transcript_63358/g.125305  ORF Transcript_63358/g.125305 Transcript_63358/m.125305 type:complete len:481 (+) Transcript_63358:121-1563(+)
MVLNAEEHEGVPRAESEVITTSQMLAALPAPRSSSEIVAPSPVFVDLMMLSPIKPENKSEKNKPPAAAPQVQTAQKEAPLASPDRGAAASPAANWIGKSAPALGRIHETPRPLKQSGLDASAGCMPREPQPCSTFLRDARQAASAAMAMAASASMQQRAVPPQLFPRPSNPLSQQPLQPPSALMQPPTAAGMLVPQMPQQPPLSPARVAQNCSAPRPASHQCQAGFLSSGPQCNRGTHSSQILGLRSLNAAPTTPSRSVGRGFLDAMAGARLSPPQPSIPGIAPVSGPSRPTGLHKLQQPSTPPPAALGLARRPGTTQAQATATRPPVPLRGTRLSSATPTHLHKELSSTRAAASRGPHINLNSWQQHQQQQQQQQHPSPSGQMISRQQQPWPGAPPLVGGGGGRPLSPLLQQQHGTYACPGIFLQPACATGPHRTLMQPSAATSPQPPSMPFGGSSSQLKPGGLPHYMGLPGPRSHIRF